MHAVEAYLRGLGTVHATGGATRERSYYGALENLLNEVGSRLQPKVRAVAELADAGAGQPDFGLYTASQFRRAKDEEPVSGALPERGVVEVKPWADDSLVTARTEQVSRYWKRYGLVLVTNYRDFVLVGHDDSGRPEILETYRMAGSEEAFLALMAHPRKAAADQGDRLLDFLRRALLYEAALTDPEDLAWFLASYAREARCRVEEAAGLPALAGLKKGLEDALGMAFEGEKGEHFFRATLVQTLFYGVFSSWVLWARNHPAPDERFDWRAAGWTLHVPMIKSLFDQIATPSKLKPLGVDEVLNWAGAALNRVDRGAFFEKFEEERAVQYFYEPFLKAYDPELRKALGVWYTPPAIVEYQVERVDRVLREELGIADGLADDQVVILDPCCGTGAYLMETLKRIHKTFEEKGANALIAHRLKQAAKTRVIGFEILPAPFVVAHLQLGLMLRHVGAPLDAASNERAGVYLTNALTGWEPAEEPKKQLPLFPELMEERDAANWVKQEAPILVILGNPPYNAFAGTSPEEEGGLVEPYKEGLTTPVNRGGWGIRKFNLDDLYVRFFRIAERRIVKSGKGVVSFISNFSYLSDPSFVVMRKRFLDGFDKLWFDCMNGDSRETGKLTPSGEPDPSVFSTEESPVGIRVGTAICVMVRKEHRAGRPVVRFQHYWGVTKRQDLLSSLRFKNLDRKYERARPGPDNRYSFKPASVGLEYAAWPSVVDIACEAPMNGLMEKRGGALMDVERDVLEQRMKAYYDRTADWETYAAMGLGLERKRAGISPRDVRLRAQSEEAFDPHRLVRYALRPFDFLWAYYSPVPGVWNRARPAYWAQCWEGNSFFVTRPVGVACPEGVPVYFSSVLGDNDFQRGHAYYLPLWVRHGCEAPRDVMNGQCVFEETGEYCVVRANLSERSRLYLERLNAGDPDSDREAAALIWMHALAVGYAPAYLSENADGIRQNWPRIPLPATKKALLASAALGRCVAALLDTERPVPGVTAGRLDPRLKSVAVISRAGGGALDPGRGHLEVTAGWGHAGQNGVCMPGKGKIEARAQKDKTLEKAFGRETLDIYLNDTAYWADVPEPVWNYYIGGYQVIKKWLSYREKAMLGRGLKMEEAEYVTEMARRIAALVLLQSDLDANYGAVKSDSSPWAGVE